MNKYAFPIYAVLIGIGLILLFKQRFRSKFKLLLAFSGAFLLSLTLFELLPEVYEEIPVKAAGLLIMAGILLQVFLEFYSKGVEHGHAHHTTKHHAFPWLLFLSLSLHAFLEGFPIMQHNDMVYGVLVHKIPISMILTDFLIRSEQSRFRIIAFLTIFTLMTPLGTWVSNTTDSVNPYLMYINALVIGIFLHISTVILFESAEGHKFNLNKVLAIVLGVAIAYAL